MSEPITGGLRRKMDTLGWYDEDGNIVYTTGDIPVSEIACLVINSKTFGELCDAIDAIHANLERENKELRHDVETWRDREGGAMGESVTERLRGLIADVNPCEIADQTLDQNLIGWSDGWRLAALMECDRIDDAVRERHAWAPESHYVMLPKDADGEPINIGDVMENIVCPSVHREVTGVGVECFYGWDDGNGRYSQFDANCYRHRHAPTVEDVLREFVDALDIDHCEDFNATIAEYAAKLQLRGDAE